MHARIRRTRSGPLVALVAAVALLLAACGSGSNSSPGVGTSGGANSSTAGGDSAAVAAAKAALAKLETRPTSLPLTASVGKPIPTGKNVTWISCGNENCDAEGKIETQIAALLGWTVTTIATDGSPQQVQNAFEQAIRQKTDAIAYAAFPRPTIENEIKAAQTANIPVVGCCTADAAGGGLIYLGLDGKATTSWGPALATWVTATSNGTGESVFVDTPEFPQVDQIAKAAESSLKQQCPDCAPMGELDIPLSSVGKDVPDRVVSYLRAHPNTKYVVLGFDAAGIGVPTAIKAAGITGVQIIGNTPTPTSLQYIESGLQTNTIATPIYEILYGGIDALARHFAGVPVQKSFTLPIWILSKSTIPNVDGDFPVVPDVQQDFEKLWGKS